MGLRRMVLVGLAMLGTLSIGCAWRGSNMSPGDRVDHLKRVWSPLARPTGTSDREPSEASEALIALRDRAQQAVDQQDWQSAYYLLDQLQDLDPLSPEPPYRLGQTLLELGYPQQAEQVLLEALDLEKDHPGALVALGEALSVLGRWQEGLENFDRAIEVAPSSARAHWLRGKSLEVLGHHDEALSAYHLALHHEPDSTQILYQVARIKRDRGRIDQAFAHIDQAQKLDPNDPEILHLRGLVLLDQKHSDRAVADLRRAETLAQNDASRSQILYALALALGQHGDPDGALQALQQAAILDPENHDAHRLVEQIRMRR